MKTVSINIRNVPVDLRREVKAKAALEGRSVQQVIIEMLCQYVAQETKGE
jgi:plasmid stability protein